VYDVYLDLSWRFLERDTWGLAGGLTPGFYGDLERMDGKTFQVTGWILGDWLLSERWSVAGGVAYVRQLQSTVLPVGGAIWRPNESMRIDLLFPRPRLAVRVIQDPAREVWAYFSGIFGGGAWAVDDGLGKNALIEYSDLRLVLGSEWTTAAGRVVTLEIGYVFGRDLSVDGTSYLAPEETLVVSLGGEF
jgi:hypothetical protein